MVLSYVSWGARRDPLQFINTTDRYLRDISADSWNAIVSLNSPPTLFQRGHYPVDIVGDDDGRPVIRTLDQASFTGHLDRRANFYRKTKNGSKPTFPPKDPVKDMMAAAQLPLPIIRGIIGAPTFVPPELLITTPGYQAETRFFLYLDPGLSIPTVSLEPNEEELTAAKRLILDEYLGDFPFAGDADRAHAIAASVQPFLRPLIQGPTPLYLIWSTRAGTGKGLLADAVSFPASGRRPSIMTEPVKYEDEWRKRLTAKLLQGPQFILIDNITRRVDSANLAAVLTSEVWEDRILGRSQMATLPVDCTWLATANNPMLSEEIARRTVSIRLVPSTPRPWERTDFRHPNLRRWAREHRGELIWANLTLIQAWIAAGKPHGEQILGSFESWAEVMGGILMVAGISGFLTDREDVYADVQDEGAEWQKFVPVWWSNFSNTPCPLSNCSPS